MTPMEEIHEEVEILEPTEEVQAEEVKEEERELTEEELRVQELQKIEEARMERIIENVRAHIFPVMLKHNKSIPASRQIVETLATVIQQGLYHLMKEYTVAALGLSGKYVPAHPDYPVIMDLLSELNENDMLLATESLQWMGAKIDMMVKNETKERSLESLNIEL